MHQPPFGKLPVAKGKGMRSVPRESCPEGTRVPRPCHLSESKSLGRPRLQGRRAEAVCRESVRRIKDLVNRGNHNHTGREGSNHKCSEVHRSMAIGDGEKVGAGTGGRGRQHPGAWSVWSYSPATLWKPRLHPYSDLGRLRTELSNSLHSEVVELVLIPTNAAAEQTL